MNITDEIRKDLFELQDLKYRDFSARLNPSVDKESIIGVRTPALRKLAKKYAAGKDIEEFLSNLPHDYFDENQLHAFIISLDRDFENTVKRVEEFLPHVNNWATCDQLSPKVFRKHKEELICYIDRWLKSGKPYTVRFAIGMLMQHYLDGDYEKKYMDRVASVKSEEYYVNMMIAWYFATALYKQYDDALEVIKRGTLSPWVHNKAIQKARESRRISPETKEYLRGFKIK